MLNLSRLQVLTEVLARGSFSEAAAALDYTQSAVSQSVQRLEAEVGTPLVVRDRRGIRATVAGQSLLAHAQAILSEVKAAEDDISAIIGVRGGRLRVGSFPSAGATLIPQSVAAFKRAHPNVTLSLVEDEPEEIAPRLRSGDLDVAVLYEFPGSEQHLAGLSVTLLFNDPMYAVMSIDHVLARKHELTLSDLSEQEWVQTSAHSPCARHVVEQAQIAGFTPRVSFESDDYDTVQGLVAAGVGVALIPQLALSRRQPGIVVRALKPISPVRNVVVATAQGPGVLPAAAAMLEILKDRAPRYIDTRGW